MKERRRFPRIESSLVTYHRKLWQTAQQFSGVSENVSAGGLCVELEGADLKPGDLVSMEIVLPGTSDSLNVIARVARREGREFGLEFVQVKDEEAKRIQEHIDACLGAGAEPIP